MSKPHILIGTTPIPTLMPGQPYKYLGTMLGHSTRWDLDKEVDDNKVALNKLDSSLFAPWQKLDAVLTSLQPRLEFAMRHATFPKKHLQKLDNVICKIK